MEPNQQADTETELVTESPRRRGLDRWNVRGLLTVTAPSPGVRADVPVFDPDVGWRLHHQVAVRPETFGALLYHFGTRKLSFLKNTTIVEVVNSLGDHDDVRSACRAAGIADADQKPYLHALSVLVTSNMLVREDGEEPR